MGRGAPDTDPYPRERALSAGSWPISIFSKLRLNSIVFDRMYPVISQATLPIPDLCRFIISHTQPAAVELAIHARRYNVAIAAVMCEA